MKNLPNYRAAILTDPSDSNRSQIYIFVLIPFSCFSHHVFFSPSPGLLITTECGKLQVSPGEMVVLPQGFRFAINLPDGPSRGYVAEVFGTHFQLPELGPIGKAFMSIRVQVIFETF